MGILGIIEPDQYLARFSKESKRDESLPYIMHKPDRLLIHLLIAVYALASAGAVTVGLDLYRKSGLTFVNPKVNGSKVYDSEEVSEMLDYCWSHFNHMDEAGEIHQLWHFRLFPYMLVVVTIMVSISQISWRATNFDEAIHALDYIIDGLEESIKDVVHQMHDAMKNSQKSATEIDGCISPTTEISSDENSGAFLVKSTSKDTFDSQSSTPFKEDKQSYGSFKAKRNSDCNYVTFDKAYRQAAEDNDWKFSNFNKILRKYHGRSRFRTKFALLRGLTFLLVFFANFFIYYQLIAPARNPSTIFCPIPSEFYDIHGVERESFQFSNTETRVLLALVTFSVSTAVLAGGIVMWMMTPAWDNGGIKLVEVLPVVTDEKIKRMRRGQWNDLIYLLSLVHVNRFRSLQLRLAFYVLAVSEQLPLKADDEEALFSELELRKKNFIKVLMELMNWPSEKDDEISEKMSALANNLN